MPVLACPALLVGRSGGFEPSIAHNRRVPEGPEFSGPSRCLGAARAGSWSRRGPSSASGRWGRGRRSDSPLAAVGGVYVGADGIRQFMVDIEEAAPDFRLDLQRAEAVGADQMVASVRTSSTGRTSGIPLGFDSTNVYDFAEGRLKRVRIFRDRQEALKAVGLEE